MNVIHGIPETSILVIYFILCYINVVTVLINYIQYNYIYIYIYIYGQRVIEIAGSLIWPKTLMELNLVNFGEIRRAQLDKSTLLASKLVPLGTFRSFKVC